MTDQTPPPGVSQNQLSMALCAIRYCMGRRSYIVSDGVAWARHYGRISPWLRGVVIRDLEEAVERIDREKAAGRTEWFALGDPMDEREWRAVLAELKALEAGNA